METEVSTYWSGWRLWGILLSFFYFILYWLQLPTTAVQKWNKNKQFSNLVCFSNSLKKAWPGSSLAFQTKIALSSDPVGYFGHLQNFSLSKWLYLIVKVWSFSFCLSTTCLWLLSNNFISDLDKNEMLVFLKSWPASTCFFSIFDFKWGGQKLSKCNDFFPSGTAFDSEQLDLNHKT